MSSNSSGPITRVFDGGEVPTNPVPAGFLAFGRDSSGEARPIEVDANGAVVVTGTVTPSNVLTELPLEISTSGDNTVIAAPGAGNRIIIYHINYLTRGAVNVRLLSGANDLSGLYTWQSAQGGGFAFDGSTVGGLPLNENEAFIINLSAAVGIDGFILYAIAGVAPSPPGGAQSLEDTLLVGNVTGGSNIELSSGDELTSAAVGATDNGLNSTIRGGPGGSTSGNGGNVALIGGTPVEGDGGSVTLTGANGVGTNQDGGDVIVAAGAATGSGAPGDITFAARGSGAIPFNESGQETLSGFTATSIVGALNELNSGGGGGAPLGCINARLGFALDSPPTFNISGVGYGLGSIVGGALLFPSFTDFVGAFDTVSGNCNYTNTTSFSIPRGFTAWGANGIQLPWTLSSWGGPGTQTTTFTVFLSFETDAGNVSDTTSIVHPNLSSGTLAITKAALDGLGLVAGDAAILRIAAIAGLAGAPPGYNPTFALHSITVDMGTT